MANNDINVAESVRAVVGKPTKKKGNWGKRLITLTVLAALAGGGYYYYQNAIIPASSTVTSYQTEAVTRGNISTIVTATGTLQPVNQVDIGTELSGTIDEVLVDDNDTVKKGQKLASLKTSQLQDNITKMEAALASARSKVAQAKAQLAQTDSKILQAKANLKQGIANAKQSSVQIHKDQAQVQQNTAQLTQSNASVQQSLAQVQQNNAQIQQYYAQIQQINAQIQQAKANITQAKATTLEARVKLNRLRELQKASGGRLPAQTELDSAVATWQKAQAAESATVSNVQALQASIGGVKANIEAAKANLASAKAGVTSSKAGVTSAQASIDSAKAGVSASNLSAEASQANVEGLQALVQSAEADKISAKANVEAVNANVIEAKANLRSAQSDLAKATIISPIDGIVLTRSVEPGQTVASSLSAPTLFTLAEDLKKMELQVSVDEADVGQVQEGQTAEFTVDAWSGRKYSATITRVSLGSTITDNIVSYTTLLMVANDDLTLRPGMTATANINTKVHENVLLVPNAALRFTPPSAAADSETKAGGDFLSKLMPSPPMRRDRNRNNSANNRSRSGEQQIWILKDNQPSPITVQIGLSNSKVTEIISDQITEGTAVITGTSTGVSGRPNRQGRSGQGGQGGQRGIGANRGAQP
ncbi:efflux RND transporter periplasmic adaptor subunit [Thiofilum flexile]|uniref:efflux RND transporter periplasmic adaptor subunit n=1 Tax=Thiofilum flexile TaxID=125627 RepID=UPI000360CA35|nr:efflux RND transporter periplasmic adaptor subunit [Thiofilum flexile]